MEAYLKIVMVFALLTSCQNSAKEVSGLSSELEKEKTPQKKEVVVSENSKPVKTLTKADFERFVPKQISVYNLIQVGEDKTTGAASGTYIKGKDYGNSMTYIVTDGRRKGSAALRSFKSIYESKTKAPEGREFVRKERDGFKTFALLKHKFNYSVFVPFWYIKVMEFLIQLIHLK
ncbi:hypothetical protein [Gelidibacter maritimus]|uniref:Uncharacterized protein n=1 Tax=Gelidibacter maritimus TaxID=2761487 RepID=A0A7W2M5N5_9FLAO|nr:hypothetical protein [Gelidibacter maritimus]MBA6153165.1 hypothetical protein [Gelidibacter maritimus]